MDGLLVCEPLPGLVAPPEHQTRLQQTLGPLFTTPVEGRPLGLWLDLIRGGQRSRPESAKAIPEE